MRILPALFAASLAALVGGMAQAQTPVAPFTVMPAGPAPRVVSSYPAEGQAVKPGVLVLRVTFDQKMLMADFDYGAGPTGEQLDCVKTPRLLNDGKSFVLLCRAWPGKTYGVTFNPSAGVASTRGGDPTGFANEGDHRAESATLSFTTTTVEPIRTLPAAMKAAGLSDIDTPIQETSNLATNDQPKEQSLLPSASQPRAVPHNAPPR